MSQGHFNPNRCQNYGSDWDYAAGDVDMRNMFFCHNQNANFNFYIGSSSQPVPPPPAPPNSQFAAANGFQRNFQGGLSAISGLDNRNQWTGTTHGSIPASHHRMYSAGGFPNQGQGYALRDADGGMRVDVCTPRFTGQGQGQQQQPVVVVLRTEPGPSSGFHHDPGSRFHQVLSQPQAAAFNSTRGSAFSQVDCSSFNPPQPVTNEGFQLSQSSYYSVDSGISPFSDMYSCSQDSFFTDK